MKRRYLVPQPMAANIRPSDCMTEVWHTIGAASACLLALSLSMGCFAQDHAQPQTSTATQRLSAQGTLSPQRSQGKAQRALTESQQILTKIMGDIRTCDKTVRYEYDSRTRSINPPELKKIKGLKLKKLYRELAVFEIIEDYEGLRAAVLVVGRPNTGYQWPIHSVAFKGRYETVRLRLEALWRLRFEDGIKPGPDVIYDGQYAETTMLVGTKSRTLSIAKMPPDVYPHITKTDVGCNHIDN